MSARRLKANAAWNIAEVLVSSAVLFVLYKLILARLGLASLGVWSLVLATTSLARIADLGAAGGLGRYIALSLAEGDDRSEGALRYLETALITNALFYGALSLLIYWPAWLVLPLVTHGAAVGEARVLLPYAIASFALLNVSNVVTAALIGLHRSALKSAVMMLALVLQLAIAGLLVGRFGLRAIALGQLAQYAVLSLAGWFLAIRYICGEWRPLLPRRVDRTALRELVGFGLRLQVLNIAAFPFEPVTKFVFSAVGGLPALGLYEIASRGFLQVRQVVVAPSQNLTPLFTAQRQQGREVLAASYYKATALMIMAAVAAMGALAIASPVISWIWLGQVRPMFVAYSVVLGLGWFCNVASTPGYYLGIAAGRLRWNITGALTTTVAAGLAGALLGRIFGPLGIAGGAMLAISAGGLITWRQNCREAELAMLPPLGEWRRLFEQFASLRAFAFVLRATKA